MGIEKDKNDNFSDDSKETIAKEKEEGERVGQEMADALFSGKETKEDAERYLKEIKGKPNININEYKEFLITRVQGSKATDSLDALKIYENELNTLEEVIHTRNLNKARTALSKAEERFKRAEENNNRFEKLKDTFKTVFGGSKGAVGKELEDAKKAFDEAKKQWEELSKKV